MGYGFVTTWTTLLWLASVIGIDPPGKLSSIPSPPNKSIELLLALGKYDSSWKGVTPAEGPTGVLHFRPAYKFAGDSRDQKLPPLEFQKVTDLLRINPEFTIAAWIQQDKNTSGSIVSFTYGTNRYLELQSSGRRNEIRLHYVSRVDSQQYTEAFPYNVADNLWHHVAISVSGSQAELFVDCHLLYKRLLRPGAPNRSFSQPDIIWLGQRYNNFYFKGSMQDVRLIGGSHGILSVCPNLDSICPTCGQFMLLQNTVEELTIHLEELSERLVAAEGRISKVEECDCQKSCHFNGSVHADGVTWQKGCDLFACVQGELKSHRVQCPELHCAYSINVTGECCQRCLRDCLMEGEYVFHGDIISTQQCVECRCNDGTMLCSRLDPEKCPKLPCLKEEQFSVPGECCKFCPGTNYCAKGHVCHANASCVNLQTTYTCHCDQGFLGNGRSCSDVNECLQEGGLDGHHCHLNTQCVNTHGSYICECLSGYRRVDKFTCAELDECTTGEHGCDVHAHCINTQGSYHCVCRDGYNGNGYSCEPICKRSCLNGGVCISPENCSCPNGYIGPNCERDLDECAEGSHRCTGASVCVNKIGWYYCDCKPGYEGPKMDNNLGTLCKDIDECKRNLHTCHPPAKCNNTDGGYYCYCPKNITNCKLSCKFHNSVVAHNESVLPPPNKPCQHCKCNNGVIICEDPICNCSNPDSSQDQCCPQCNQQFACHHQELDDIILMHGETWSYQCQTCECWKGEIDCWTMDCPPLLCDNPVQTARDCCPHCEDMCSFGNTSLSDGRLCAFSGKLFESGAHFADPKDPCVSCNCNVPFCAQLVSNVACCVHRMEYFAAVLICTVVVMNSQWAMTDWWPLRHPWPDIPLLVIAKPEFRAVQILDNIVQVLIICTSVTLGKGTRLITKGVEICRREAGLTFLDTSFEPPVQ